MRKNVASVLFALGLISILGGAGYAASSRGSAPATATGSNTSTLQGAPHTGGNTVTVQGTPLEGGGCTYSFSAAPPGQSQVMSITYQDIPNERGGHTYGTGMSVAAPSSGSVGMISEDLSSCTAVFEVGPGGAPTVPTGGMSASSSTSATSPHSINTVTVPDTPPGATKITFGGLSENGSPFTTYNESGFNVSANSGSWEAMTSYGHPAPAIVFKRSANDPTSTAEVEITHSGSAFRFQSVELYSSVTPIPYTISGYRNSELVFTLSETVPNTFGNFAKVTNPGETESIDRLTISLTNPETQCCWNPVGLDNIVLS